jgi:hypothetical protein
MAPTHDSHSDPSVDVRLDQAYSLILRLLTRAMIPLVIVIGLTTARIAIGTFGQRGTTVLLYGALAAAVTMFIYALPTVFMAQGKPRPWWTGIASVLGILPLLYGVYLGAVGGALGAFRANSILEAGLGVLFLLAGFAYVRDFSRLAVLGRAIEATLSAG